MTFLLEHSPSRTQTDRIEADTFAEAVAKAAEVHGLSSDESEWFDWSGDCGLRREWRMRGDGTWYMSSDH